MAPSICEFKMLMQRKGLRNCEQTFIERALHLRFVYFGIPQMRTYRQLGVCEMRTLHMERGVHAFHSYQLRAQLHLPQKFINLLLCGR
ncbi:unnamed protein product [Toxocara canis]|uniref:DUF772 domain-containing protein n=1 Tax=Toxocara canis TaxID=6265 RepID=A0A183UER6_TOXCA|nr:unnamed protein product [Toxocara canis]